MGVQGGLIGEGQVLRGGFFCEVGVLGFEDGGDGVVDVADDGAGGDVVFEVIGFLLGAAAIGFELCSLHQAALGPGDRTVGGNRDRSFDRQRGSLSEGARVCGPRQYSTGGKAKLYGISKGGNCYLRKILVHGARAVVLRSKRDRIAMGTWMTALEMRAPKKRVDHRHGEQAGTDRMGGAFNWTGLSRCSECNGCAGSLTIGDIKF